MARIELRSVRKIYGDLVAVEDISLAIDDRQCHCLVGPNGSGKTTLFRLILGLTRPSSGTIDRTNASVGCGFQRPNFYPDLTVDENIGVFTTMAGGVDEKWRETLLTELRLERALDQRAGDLSGGFSRKLDLALALLKQPDVLLLDEPLGDLDDVSKTRVVEFLSNYRDAGKTLLISTHHVAAFEPILDRLTILHDGAVVTDGLVGSDALPQRGNLHEFYVQSVIEREGVDQDPVLSEER